MKQGEPSDPPARPQQSASASLFGRFQLRAADGSEIVISNSRARALLAMLCLAKGEAIDRDFLSKMLWHGRFEAHAKASLRQCLLELKKLLGTFGTDILDVSRASVSVHRNAISTDLDALEDALARKDYATATSRLAAIGTKPILDQMDFGGAFNQWLARYSADAERRLRDAVEGGLSALEQAGDASVRKQFLSIWSLRSLAASSASQPSSPLAKTRIAVLPFHSVAAADGPDYFADGIVDELITTLGQVPQMLVAGRTSSFHFRGSELASAQIAAELGVSHLVEGSVQRHGDVIRLHVHLIAGDTGFELWAERFDGTLDNVFAFQEQVAQAITAAIGRALGIAMQPPLVREMTHNKEAFELYLQGQSLCARRFGDGVLETAVTLFEQALALDPDFAECWVALAEAHQLVSVYTQCLDRNGEAARMSECAQRAIALSPQLAYPYSLLGIFELTRFNFVGALDYAYQAYRLDPNNPAVAMRLASCLMFIGRTKDAAPYIKAAVTQDPADGRKYALFCGVQLCTGDLPAANETAQRMVDLGMPSTLLALTSAALGNRDLAIRQYLQSQSMINHIILPPVGIGIQTPEAMDAYWLLAAKAISGGSLQVRQNYWQVLEMLYAVLHDKSDLAICGPAVLTGNPELVFKTIGQSISPSNLMALVPFWADIEPIRQIWQHPEFIPFAQRIGMAAAWEKYGWPDLLPPPDNRVSGVN